MTAPQDRMTDLRDIRVLQLDAMSHRRLVRLLADLEQHRVLYRECPLNRLSREELIADILETEGYGRTR